MRLRSSLDRRLHFVILRCATALLASLVGLAWNNPPVSGEIYDAALDGDVAKVKALLKRDPNLVVSRNKNDWTPLHVATLNGDTDTAELLLTNRADNITGDNKGVKALHRASGQHSLLPQSPEVQKEHDDIAELLRQHGGQDVSAPTQLSPERTSVVEGSTCDICSAARAGDLEKVQALLKDNPNAVLSRDHNHRHFTPLHWAASEGHKNVAELLLLNHADVDATDGGNGRYSLSRQFKSQADSKLLSFAAAPDLEERYPGPQVKEGGGTPLHYAAAWGHKDLVEMLLASHADVNAKTEHAYTPLHYAAARGQKEVVELLLSNSAEVDAIARTVDEPTPLAFAAALGHRDVAELLVANHAEINPKYGTSPFAYAVSFGQKEVAEALLSKTARDEIARSLLFLVGGLARPSLAYSELPDAVGAAEFQFKGTKRPLAEWLLANGADLNIKDRGTGDTPLHYAAQYGDDSMVDFLLAHKAKVNEKDSNGWTPLYVAVCSGHHAVAELLHRHGGRAGGGLMDELCLNYRR